MISSLLVGIWGLASHQGPIRTPYALSEALAIRGAKLSAVEVPVGGLEEIDVAAQGTFDNPFDPEDVALDAEITPPIGKPYSVPGFLYRPFERSAPFGREQVDATGSSSWRLRISPMELGEHRIEIAFRDRTGTVRKGGFRFRAVKSGATGRLRLSPRDPRYFELADGTPFYPVGENLAWAGGRGTADYDDWLAELGKVGANFARVFLSPSDATFALDIAGKPEDGKGIGQFDLGNAWRLDHVFETARQKGVYLQLCLESFGVLRDRDLYPWWEKTPENRDNGGPLRIWSDFWTDPQMDRFFRAKLRYLVARYGAYSNLFAWELWNEVDHVRDFAIDPVRAWHQRMIAALKKLDPYGHLVTTSVADPMGIRDLELPSDLDIFQTHLYGAPDLVGAVVTQQSRKAWGRPHLVTEVGADPNGPRAKDDPTGLQIHDPVWASVASGVSGTACPWWWDNYVATNKLYPIFGAAARFVQGIDWPGEDFQLADLTFAYAKTPLNPPRRDLMLEGGPVSWTPSGANRPATVKVDSDGVSGALPLAGIQHGLRNHPDLHNPVLFKVNVPRETRFDVLVGAVSPAGGAQLQVELDADRVMTRTFVDPAARPEGLPVTKFAGSYSILIPKGIHTVKVENVGADWFFASYRFAALMPRYRPPLEGWAIVGNDTVVGWFRLEGRTWLRECVLKQSSPPSPPSVVGIMGLPAGTWTVDYWDTWKGEIVSKATLTVQNDGKIRVPLPPIVTDLAIKIRKRG